MDPRKAYGDIADIADKYRVTMPSIQVIKDKDEEVGSLSSEMVR